MAIDTDKNSYTIVFAIVMVVIVGSILSGLASGLKPLVKANERFEKQQNILYAMGINGNEGISDVEFISTDKVEDVFKNTIKKQYVIEGDKVTENPEAYLIDIKKEETKSKDPNYTRKLPLFEGEKDGKPLYVVPIRGKGLWDAIWGFVAVDKSMVVQGVFFDHAGETPGLGSEIKQRYFMDDFEGEHLLNASGKFEGITVAKGNADPKNERKTDNAVDAIAGATITGDGVTAMIKKDLKMYVPFFKTLK
ncbi:Na+-transporting NADH:ubiquinone oxidoreductase subunit C [Winogradskyella epiphytica]|uniref:Na(+)-translocating NADH-quinone reductase subunit C n=1 Tax=Winogradskyella epiphytica TaxID=262005 RepID=A0A2V4YFI2_9FLAO|nr:Na(+)-translocating NADH-quinone reductase subunit C [Winogradskyella epiphytica]PYE82663.1 Na+-transporting NADH:ubiquinone oxidoreductase subunit C [Winogradskyella epiphytica]GGW72529.1 Na(+)-translocating NADH-quinone reductase subunit C [Winogradskyella epiphytica]